MGELRGFEAWMNSLSEQELPTLDAVVKEICELSENEKTRAEDLTHIILRDADLTSKVLQIANSVHYNPSFRPIKTVSRAIVQLGFENLRNITLATALIESFLRGKPKELMIQCLARSFHAAVQAKAMVPHLSSDSKEQVFIAALLRNLGELALIASGREQVEKFILARNQLPEQERQLAQDHLGVDVNHLTRHLVREWKLGDLLVEACDNRSQSSDAARAVNLGNELSRHIHRGIKDPEVQKLCDQASRLCKITPEEARKQVLLMADEAAVIAKSYGVEVLISALPDPHQLEHEDQEAQPKPDYYFQHQLNEIHQLMLMGEDISKITQVSINALCEGAGMARVVIALVDYTSKSLDVRYTAGRGTHLWLQLPPIKLDNLRKGELLHDFLRSQQPLWHQPQLLAKETGALKVFAATGDIMLAPLFLNKRLVAILYADGLAARFNQRQFEEFQLIANQLNLMMRINASAG